MAAGQRKFKVKEIRFSKDGADIRCDVEFSWGIEETDGQIQIRRGNTTSFNKAELIANLTAEERAAIMSVFGKIQTAIKTKVVDLTNAIEE